MMSTRVNRIVDDDAESELERVVPDDAPTEYSVTVVQERIVPDDALTVSVHSDYNNERARNEPSDGAIAREAETGTIPSVRSDRERRGGVDAKPSAGISQVAASATPAPADGPGPFPGAQKAVGNDEKC